MKLGKFVSSVFFSMSACMLCLAQEIPATSELPESGQQEATLTKFDLVDNPDIDKKILDLLKNNVSVLNHPAEKVDPAELRLLRFSVRREIAGILATEGYFSPAIKFEVQTSHADNPRVTVQTRIELGLPTNIASVQINFVGDVVPVELQQTIRSTWRLKAGKIFREDDWSRAKSKVIQALAERSYAAAKITDSEAVIQDQQANLSVTVDSGLAFSIGEIQIKGLKLYKPWLLGRYHPPVKGEAYDQVRLLKFQRDLQNSPYFSSVTVSVDPIPEKAGAVPVEVLVAERDQYDVGLAAGFSTNTGARGEVSLQDRNFYGDAYNLKSAIRIEQLRQIGYADVYLPPKPSGYLDSVGVLFERSDIAGLVTQTGSFGAKRVVTENSVEKRLGLSFIYEQSAVDGGQPTHAKALVPSIGRTWRAVDNIFEPRKGHVTQADMSGGTKLLLSDQNFVRLYGKYQRWVPVGKRDVIILRVEGGYVLAHDTAGIPENYLFRAGGTASVRGYSYESIGVNAAGGVLGGRVLTTASAEYVHWLNITWGIAAFADVGDAADRFSDLNLRQGIGMGVRYKTPAGPIGVDIAYGRQDKKYRLDFSLGIAF